MNKSAEFYRAMVRIETIRKSSEAAKNSLSARRDALRRLENDGFNIKDEGTQYLASIIAIYFHERKLYERCKDREAYKGYWDLSDLSNKHYGMLGHNPERVIQEIYKAIGKNDIEDGPIDEMIYEITDNMIHSYDRDDVIDNDKEFISYTKILKK